MNSKSLWPGWETTRLIGCGSFGVVYEIQRKLFEDEDEVEKAALKVISIPQNDSDIEEMYSDGYDEESVTSTFHTHLKSIVAEYSLMRKMNGSSNIVNCDDVRYVQHDDGIGWDIYIKMELLTPLAKALPATVSEEQIIKIAKDMCAALELCSKHNIIHRDIKPQNIFVSENGDYKLGDFGIAKTVEKTMGGTKTGTYKYMAPEVYSNRPYNSTADIYSLGLVLYWLLNERRMPFMPLPPEKLRAGMDEESRSRRFSGEKIPAPKNGSDELKRIVLKACAFDPKDRYQSAREMREALARLGGEYVSGSSTQYLEQNFHDDPSNQNEEPVVEDTPVDDPEGETVGPIFNHQETVDEEELGKTAGPTFNQQTETKKVSIIAVAVGIVLILLLLILLLRSGGESQAETLKVNTTEGHTHIWSEALCDTPKTCSNCGETSGNALGHQWEEATEDMPKVCTRCGITEGKSLGMYLTKCIYVEDSNEAGSRSDVDIGNWVDCTGVVHKNALRFWVSGRSGMSNMEYAVFDLERRYNEIEFNVQLAEKSHSGSTAYIKIYADGRFLESSQVVGKDSSSVSVKINVENVDYLRVECITDSSKDAYCIVDAKLYVE